MNYSQSVELALSLGYEEVENEGAYNGCYFIKNGLKWIHDIDALKICLSSSSDEELRILQYDVDSYYQHHSGERPECSDIF